MGFWDVFYNSTLIVQSLMLLASLAAFACPCYLVARFMHTSREDYLPPDTVFAIRRNKDVLQVSFNRNAPLTHEQTLDLLADLSVTKNGPTDMQ